jgi:hypothetical protein
MDLTKKEKKKISVQKLDFVFYEKKNSTAKTAL